jgi:hypothetical protein
MAKIESVIPEAHLAAIGHVANTAANVELQIDLGIWALVGSRQQLAACVTAQLISPHPRLKAFTALAEILGATPGRIRELNTLAGIIAGLYEKRNRIVHDPRMVKQDTGAVQRLQVTAKPKVRFGFIEETADEVIKVAEDLNKRGKEFMQLRDLVISEIDALHRTSSVQLTEIIPGPAP